MNTKLKTFLLFPNSRYNTAKSHKYKFIITQYKKSFKNNKEDKVQKQHTNNYKVP